MPCCVPLCPSNSSAIKISLFSIPKTDILRLEWEKVLGITFKAHSKVCLNHFKKEDIIDTWESGKGISKYTICLKNPRLREGAIPLNNFILGNTPLSEHKIFGEVSNIYHDHCYDLVHCDIISQNNSDVINESTTYLHQTKKIMSQANDDTCSLPPSKRIKIHNTSHYIQDILKKIESIEIPSKWHYDVEFNLKTNIISFYKLGPYRYDFTRCVEKQLILTENSLLSLYIHGKKVENSDIGYISDFGTVEELQHILRIFDKIQVCQGSSVKLNYATSSYGDKVTESHGIRRHLKCTTIIKKDLNKNSNVCIWCKRLNYIIKNKNLRMENNQNTRVLFSPNKKKTLQQIKNTRALIKKKFTRASKRIIYLENNLQMIKNKMTEISQSRLEELLENSDISKSQAELIHEIFNAAKVNNSKNRRYSENWMLLCMLLQIRSPSGYSFLRNNNILPLPCTNSIRTHLLSVEIGCGFDKHFFKLLKKKLSNKTEQERQGVILLDEIFLRESISLNSRTLTYSGLEDYGGEIDTDGTLKANHALVFMWQSLADKLVQPIAVFASRGPVKGVDLAKLTIRVIMLMENAGGQVVGLTCDGASTNRTMWSQLGISAKLDNFKNYFQNPFESSRKVFVFSDAPHLLKTIRNRLYEKKQLIVHPSNNPIKWDYYFNIFKIEANSILKVCPKLSKNHIELNNLSKMKVKYAAQLFSMSVANGIEFYLKKQFEGFKDSEETIKFTKMVNNMFDILNRKFPAEGIRKNSQDLEVLNEILKWFIKWESNLIENLIEKNDFLSQNTADGLKITLQSTIDAVNYLLNEKNFAYVLTSKFNQDCLEQFFGIIRQVAGPNDHPSCPSFLQLYRMLSVYSLIKPPKSGNCMIFEDNVPIITIADIKEIVKENNNSSIRIDKIEKLKEKLNKISDEGCWDADEIFLEHNYSDATVFDCIVYYLAGYMAKRLSAKSKCQICASGLKNLNTTSYGTNADLITAKNRGYLTHPDSNLFKIIKALEISLTKCIDSPNAFEEACDDFFKKNINFNFPCEEHRLTILTDICSHYIIMRMRQYTFTQNQNSKKLNKAKKKLSKLVNT